MEGAVSYQLSAKELANLLFRRTFFRRTLSWGFGIICIVLLFVAISYFATDSVNESGFVILGVVVLIPLFAYISIRKAVNHNPMATAQTKLTYRETGLYFETPHSQWEVAWPGFIEWKENQKYLFLWIGTDKKVPAVVIPKRAFTADQLATFKDLLKKINAYGAR